ncbi:hypothetical protein VUR80DRAFT_9441 [Thermomyces stellatus]
MPPHLEPLVRPVMRHLGVEPATPVVAHHHPRRAVAEAEPSVLLEACPLAGGVGWEDAVELERAVDHGDGLAALRVADEEASARAWDCFCLGGLGCAARLGGFGRWRRILRGLLVGELDRDVGVGETARGWVRALFGPPLERFRGEGERDGDARGNLDGARPSCLLGRDRRGRRRFREGDCSRHHGRAWCKWHPATGGAGEGWLFMMVASVPEVPVRASQLCKLDLICPGAGQPNAASAFPEAR